MRINFFFWRGAVTLVLAAGLAQAASATTFYYCYVGKAYGGWDVRYVSEIKQTDLTKVDEMKTGFAFSDEIEAQWYRDYPNEGSRKSGCSSSTNLDSLRKDHANALSDGARQLSFTRPPLASKTVESGAGIVLGSPQQQSSRGEKADPSIQDKKPTAAASELQAPVRPKNSNAQADAEYAAALAVYERQMAAHREQFEDHERAQDEVARRKREQKVAAERAAAEYQRQLAAHARIVRNQQLEYQKEVAKPAGVPNAVYRGFWARDCDAARKSATLGAGTSSTTRFKEVTNEPGNNGCVVQGWWWNVAGGGNATRQ